MPRYLNQDRRETIFWVASGVVLMRQALDKIGKPEARKWADSYILSGEEFMAAEMAGCEQREKDTVVRLTRDCRPTIRVNGPSRDDYADVVQVRREVIEDFAEWALTACLRCEGDYQGCTLRKLSEQLGIPAYVDEGPCPYWQKEGAQ